MTAKLNASTSSGLVVSPDNSGILELQTNGAAAVTVDASQKVGVGTTSPSYLFHVQSAGQANAYIFNSSNSVGLRLIADSTQAYVQTQTNHPLVFAANNGAEAIRIDTSGNVQMGGTTAVARTTVTSPTGYTYASVSYGNGADHFIFKTDSTTTGSITRVGGTSIAYNTSSDYRLKENIAPMIDALAKVQQLKPVTYSWKADGSNGEGFIAHELAEVIPQAVHGEKDAIESDGSIKAQGVDYSKIVATLTAAIQELNAKVDAQAVEIAALKGTV